MFKYQKLGKIFSLNSSKRQLLISTFVLLILVNLGLSMLSFKKLHKLLLLISKPQAKYQKQAQISLEDIIWAVNVSTFYIPGGAKCLSRALTSSVFMSRCCYISSLYIGVAKSQSGELKAHAWVESQGKVVVGNLPELDDYKQLLSLSSNNSQTVSY